MILDYVHKEINMQSTQREAGFTLIELMVTVAILAVIAGIAIPAYNGYVHRGYTTECSNEVATIQLAQSEYFLENNAYFPNPAGTANGVAAIEGASGGFYTSGYTVAGDAVKTAANIAAANCDFSVTSTAAPSYTINVTGQNHLDATDNYSVTK